MSKITGLEEISRVPPKVSKMYEAVMALMVEGTDVSGIRVSTITERAGIGKGTAYEYFDTKEEIVVCAIVNKIQSIFGWLESVLLEKESFGEQLEFLLDEMGKKDGREYCFIKFVHMLTDTSELSKMVREKVAREEFAPYQPVKVFENVLQRAVDRGELRADLPLEYMIYCLFSHLITYMVAEEALERSTLKQEVMRTLVYQGIIRELQKF